MSNHLLATLLACGIDPQKTLMFFQSDIPAHSELFYLFNTCTPIHLLNNMIQFKQKKRKASSAALMNYPMLMAADILLYNPLNVPVGEDQTQHLELTHEILRRFNQITQIELFNRPTIRISKSGKRLMDLQDVKHKMSKSNKSQKGIINLFDSSDVFTQKIMKAKTDSNSIVTSDETRFEVNNLINLYSSLACMSIEDTLT